MLTLQHSSAKSKAYCCCLQFWLPIDCVVLDLFSLDQHMQYCGLDLLKTLVNRPPIDVLEVSAPKVFWTSSLNWGEESRRAGHCASRVSFIVECIPVVLHPSCLKEKTEVN